MPMALSSSASFLRNPSNILPSSGSGSGLSSKFHGTISPRPLLLPPPHPLHHRSSSSSSSTCFAQVFHPAAAELEAQAPGGKMVAELVGAFNNLTQRMGMLALSTTSSHLLLFNSLKLSIPLLYPRPPSDPNDVRSPLTRALSVACLLADLQMDAEVISASILRVALEMEVITMHNVKRQIGITTAHLMHDSMRLTKLLSTVEILDDDTAALLIRFCLTYYDIRAIVLELAFKLDRMRNLNHLPRYAQQVVALEVLQIYAPLAHAIGAGTLSLELEDLSLRYLFPYSYLYVDTWLRSHETVAKPSLIICKELLHQALKEDPEVQELVDGITIKSRYKSRFSTMKKLLKDGRKPEKVHDLLGLRVILDPRTGDDVVERGHRACHRVHEVIQSLWKCVPSRTKDYISKPKKNGYRSLHVAVDVSDNGKARPLMEIQIRTAEMETSAGGGSASHSLYKGGLTDPAEVINSKDSSFQLLFQAKRLKDIMLAAAQFAALRLRDIPVSNQGGSVEADQRDPMFHLLDKNGDGRICMDELTEVIEELGAESEDAHELMQLLDVNSDGSLSSDEFDSFQRQVRFMWNMENKDGEYRAVLGEKLQMADSSGLIQVYRKEFGDRLALI